MSIGQPIPTAVPHDHDGKIVSRKRWTIQEVEALSSWEYKRLLQNPDFVAAMDALQQPQSDPKPE